MKKNEKLIDLDIYFRIWAMKNGKEEISYARLTGRNKEGYTKSVRERFEKGLIKSMKKDKYRHIYILPCSVEEAITGVEHADKPIGTYDIYMEVSADKNGKKMVTYEHCSGKIMNYMSEDVWNYHASELKEKYLNDGYSNIEIVGCGKGNCV